MLKCWIANSESNGVDECIFVKSIDSFSNLYIGYADGTGMYVNLSYLNNTIKVERIYSEGYWGGITTISLMAYSF